MARQKRHWLMKCEPDVFSIDDLRAKGKTHWEGVRNYQARNFMRDDMRVGDEMLFYHSNADPSGVAGLGRVCREGYPDFFQWDKNSKYYDPGATRENPRWFMVDVEFVEKFPRLLPIGELRGEKTLTGMLLFAKGSRLSIQPVSKAHYDRVVRIGRGS